jgi:hypothetical protein
MRTGSSAVLLTLVCAAAVARPAPADACPQWKVPPVFIAQQDDRYEVSFQLKQSGSTLSGYARYATNKRTVIGNVVQATLSGNRFSARVLWTYSGARGIGRYIGVVDPSGRLHGNVHDEQSPKPVNVGWRSPQPMRCDPGTGVTRPGASAGSTNFIETFGPQKSPRPPLVTNQAMPNIKDKTRPSSSGAVMRFPINRLRPVR